MKKFNTCKSKLIARVSIAAACCLLVGGISVGAYTYMAPASYVSMDVNPSIEYTLNMFDRVLSVRAVNDDGAKILQEVNLSDFSNKSIDDAIKLTLGEITAKGYFDGNAPGGVVIATSGKESIAAESLAKHLKEIVAALCAENKHTVSIETMTVNQAQLDEAKALGVTPGKLQLVKELQSENPQDVAFAIEAWLTKSVKEIMAEVERVDALQDGDKDADDQAEDDVDDADDLTDSADDAADDAEDIAEDAEEAKQEAAEDAEDIAEDAEEAKQEAAEDAEDAAEDAADKQRDAKDKANDLAAEKAEEEAEIAEEAQEANNPDHKDDKDDADDKDDPDDIEDVETEDA